MEEPKKPKRKKKNPLETVAGKKSLTQLNRILRTLHRYEPIHAAHDLVAAHRKDALRHALHGHLCRWCAENGRPDDVETLFPFTGLPPDQLPALLDRCLARNLSFGLVTSHPILIKEYVRQALYAADAVRRRSGRRIYPKEIAALFLLAKEWLSGMGANREAELLVLLLGTAANPRRKNMYGTVWTVGLGEARAHGALSRAEAVAYSLMVERADPHIQF